MSRRKNKTRHGFPVVIERQVNGFFAYCPALAKCYCGGQNYESAIEGIRKHVYEQLQAKLSSGGTIPQVEGFGFTIVEVEI